MNMKKKLVAGGLVAALAATAIGGATLAYFTDEEEAVNTFSVGNVDITLTESGKEIADRIYERHTLLSSWLERLGVDPKTAAEDACRIEHVISAESFEAIKKHVNVK